MREARPPIPPAREGGPRRPGAARRGAAGPERTQGRGGGGDGGGRAGGAAEPSAPGEQGQPRGRDTRGPPAGRARSWSPDARSRPTPAEGCGAPREPGELRSRRGAAAGMDEPWWEGRVASDVHCTLREKELKLPAFRAHSPLLKSRRFFVDILTLLSRHCQLCPTARHLAVYLLDHFMDQYNVTTSKQLYTVAVSCLLLASKFEDREDRVPKLEQINSSRILSSHNFSLTKKELLSTELLLLGAFRWDLCLPTSAHFLDYYLLASISHKDHHCHTWPTTCPRKTKECLREYAHYFLEVTLQDHIFYKFQPSVVAAACIGASRICLQLSPYWTRDLQRVSNYTLEHLSTCIDILLVAYDNVLKDAVAVKSQALAMVPGTPPTPTQVLFQPPVYPALSQPSPTTLTRFQSPVQDLCLAYRDSLQAHRSGTLLSGDAVPSLHAPYPTLHPLDMCPMPVPPSLSMQMAIAVEPRHCLAATYGSSYFSGSHIFPAGCFDS